nr:hypothetical protein Iba_chr14cCG4570 [Ipomoea batatas]
MAVSGGGALRRSSVGAAHQQIANIKLPPWDSAVVRGCGRSERSACSRGEGGGDMVLSPSFRRCKVAECPGGTPISVRQLQRWRLAVLRYGAMVAAAARVFSFRWAAMATASNPARPPSSPPSSFPSVPLEPTHDRASFYAWEATGSSGNGLLPSVDDVPPEQQLVLGSVKRRHRAAAMAVSGGGALRRSSVGAAHQQIANSKLPPWDSAVVRGCGRSERSACSRAVEVGGSPLRRNGSSSGAGVLIPVGGYGDGEQPRKASFFSPVFLPRRAFGADSR